MPLQKKRHASPVFRGLKFPNFKKIVSRKAEVRTRLQKKIVAIGKMAKYFHTLREESETVLQLKGLTPGGKLPSGALSQGSTSLNTHLTSVSNFEDAKALDRLNERMPARK